MQCSNNLKQIGIAFHNYIDKNANFMPPQFNYRGAVVNPPSTFFSSILPGMEQNAVYDAIYGSPDTIAAGDSQAPRTTKPWQAPCVAAYRTEIAPFLCPSDGNNKRPTTLAPGRINYRLCQGDWPAGGNAASEDWRGIASGQVRGKLSLVSDGTSNTALCSERNCGGGQPNDKKSGIHNVSGVFGGTNNRLINPQICLTTDVSGNQILNGVTDTNPGDNGVTMHDGFVNNASGYAWIDGESYFITFHTVLPPNSPSCSEAATGVQNSRNLVSASSSHSGGVNLVMCDGSVKFVSETVDCGSQLNQPPGGTTAAPVTPTNNSRYGVWGAIGTPAGKESKSL
jgi:prepilin-type processing-associated H-X9-DG protein